MTFQCTCAAGDAEWQRPVKVYTEVPMFGLRFEDFIAKNIYNINLPSDGTLEKVVILMF